MSGAAFSPDRVYRYALTRDLQPPLTAPELGSLLFVCLNPSTADEQADDPTVRRCLGYARAWGYSRLVVCNIFALRSTDPAALYDHPDPVGPENDSYILREAVRADRVVAAWGTHGALRGRGPSVLDSLLDLKGDVWALGLTKDGHPRHPLYVAVSVKPMRLGE